MIKLLIIESFFIYISTSLIFFFDFKWLAIYTNGVSNTATINFIKLCQGKLEDTRTNPKVSLESHIMAFAAEESRVTGKVVNMDEFVGRFNK